MKLGFYGNYTEETVKFASETGFKCMELSAWPHSSLNPDTMTDRRLAEIRKDLERHDIEVSALGYYPNFLDPDKAESGEACRYFLKVLDLAAKMEVGVVSTFVGRDPDRSVEDNIPAFKELFTRFCDEAESRNVKIAIENCPMVDHQYQKSYNIAHTPQIWEVMFKEVPSKCLGLEIDPAHMVWQGIDYVQAIRSFGDKIFHVHAKDMEIRRDVLARTGIYGLLFEKIDGLGHGWWRARTPGWGEVNWPAFITALLEVDYNGNVDIEHEDDVFIKATAIEAIEEESDIVNNYGKDKTGLVLGYRTLSRLIP